MFVCPVPRISQVMMKCAAELHILSRFTLWKNGHRRASHLGRFTLWKTAAELNNSVDLLCGTTAAELHNSVDLHCGTTYADLHNSPVNLLCGTTDAEFVEKLGLVSTYFLKWRCYSDMGIPFSYYLGD